MDFNKFLDNVIRDLKVELTDEFDKNFERKAFFDQAWPVTKMANSKGSLMQRTGALRGSIESQISSGRLEFSSSEAYASIHNEGGEIVVTAKMKAYFWAMFYKADNAKTFKRAKDKSVVIRDTQKNKRLTAEAEMYRNLALMKVGTVMKIEQRQFIGHHKEVDKCVQNVIDDNIAEINKQVLNALKP